MKIRELDFDCKIEKTFEERRKDAMNWFFVSLKMCLKILKLYLAENKFVEFVECEKQIVAYCAKFYRTIGAIKNEEMQKIIKEEIEKAFETFEVFPVID